MGIEEPIYPEKLERPAEDMADFLAQLIDPAARELLDVINKDLATSNLTPRQKEVNLRRLYFVVKLLNYRDKKGEPMFPRSLRIMFGLIYGDLNLSRSVGAKQLELLFTRRAETKQRFEEGTKKKKLKKVVGEEW